MFRQTVAAAAGRATSLQSLSAAHGLSAATPAASASSVLKSVSTCLSARHSALPASIGVRSRSSATPPMPVPPKHTKTTYKDPKDKVAPKSVRMHEADQMGRIDFDEVPDLAPRTVPKSHQEYNHAKHAFKKAAGEYRKLYAQQWADRRTRESAAIRLQRERIDAQKARRAEKKAVRSKARREEHEARMTLQWQQRRLQKEVNQASRDRYMAAVKAKRVAWLDGLEADAKGWLTAETVDEAIPDSMFEQGPAWQYERYFDHLKRRELAAEAAERGEKGGILAGSLSDDEFDSDWDSDADADDVWSPLHRKLQTGLQLHELSMRKRTSEFEKEWKEFEKAYGERYSDIVKPELMMSDNLEDMLDIVSTSSVEDQLAEDALRQSGSGPARGASADGKSPEELDEIYEFFVEDYRNNGGGKGEGAAGAEVGDGDQDGNKDGSGPSSGGQS